jgi:hypothetical protein
MLQFGGLCQASAAFTPPDQDRQYASAVDLQLMTRTVINWRRFHLRTATRCGGLRCQQVEPPKVADDHRCT